MTALTAMDKLLFWLGLGAAQKGARSKEVRPRLHWVVSLVAGILLALLITAGAFILLVSQQWCRRWRSQTGRSTSAFGGRAVVQRTSLQRPGFHPICDIIAQFLLWCTAAFFRNGVVMSGFKPEEGRSW
jgi:hypothetical protein